MEDKTCSRDAISLLPDDVLGKILSLLPTEEAASTSVLSKRWRNVYRLVDNLDFDDSALGVDKLERDVLWESTRNHWESIGFVMIEQEVASYMFPESFEKFVDTTLALQGDYSPIKRFSLKCHVGMENDCQKTSVSRWISNVVERGVLELDLRIKGRHMNFLPPQLFTSETLAKLTLGTKLKLVKLPSYVSLPSLKTLFIDTVIFEKNDYLCDVLLAGCPALEELSVHHNDYSARPNTISSPTVKRLSVNFCSPDGVVRFWSCISFDLPKLVYLDYSHFAPDEYGKVNMESLVEAKLNLNPLATFDYPDITKLLFGIRNVEILHLSPDSVFVLYSYFSCELPVFNNLVKLYFGSRDTECWKLLPHLIKQSPKLETLIVQGLDSYTGDVTLRAYQVKVLRVRGYRGTSEELEKLMSFIGKTRSLELVQLEIEEGVMVDSQTKRDLMMLPRVSVSCNCRIEVVGFI